METPPTYIPRQNQEPQVPRRVARAHNLRACRRLFEDPETPDNPTTGFNQEPERPVREGRRRGALRPCRLEFSDDDDDDDVVVIVI